MNYGKAASMALTLVAWIIKTKEPRSLIYATMDGTFKISVERVDKIQGRNATEIIYGEIN